MNDDLDEVLIEEVRERPLLYDVKNVDYKCVKRRENAWKEIGAVLNLTDVQCKKRWKGLRDSYKRYKNVEQVTRQSGSEAPKRKWRYAKIMSFLDNLKPGKSYNDIYLETCDELNSQDEHDPIEMGSIKSLTLMSEEEQNFNASSPMDQEESARTKKFEKFLDQASSSISETCAALATQRRDRDSTALLFTSLAAKIREAKLPMNISNQIEAKVTALVFSEIDKYQDYLCDEKNYQV